MNHYLFGKAPRVKIIRTHYIIVAHELNITLKYVMVVLENQ